MPVKPAAYIARLELPDAVPTAARPVTLLARDLDTSELIAPHSHRWGQVTYAREGLVRVTVSDSTWIVPPLRAIWIPPNVVHELATLEKAQLRGLFVYEGARPFQGSDCVVLDVSPLLRELIVALTEDKRSATREVVLAALILDELAHSATLPMRVALPADKRLRALCARLLADPAAPLTLDQWAKQIGMSERTLARRFEQDLGMTFGQWRQQMRLAHAAPLIARGLPLSQVAAELGYASQSAFSAMFKKTFGQSPSTFYMRKAE
ncbi:MAG: helix-turn-helix transcriptional regulator [Pseudomonadota bacterium]